MTKIKINTYITIICGLFYSSIVFGMLSSSSNLLARGAITYQEFAPDPIKPKELPKLKSLNFSTDVSQCSILKQLDQFIRRYKNDPEMAKQVKNHGYCSGFAVL